MADLLKFLCLAFFLVIVVNGQSECTTKDLKVSQSRTGKKVSGKMGFNVTVTNTCVCTALNVKLSCAGFRPTEALDGSVMSKSGDACLLNNGSPIYGSNSSFTFNYVRGRTLPLSPLSADFACS